jgi:predicted PhzF superfamily epimerase YddE/YHI9
MAFVQGGIFEMGDTFGASGSYHALPGLERSHMHPNLPFAVESTGLAYLLIPVVRVLENARIAVDNIKNMLKELEAKFVHVYNVAKREGRT